MLLLVRQRHESGQITAAELKDQVEDIHSILLESRRILCLEDPASPEGAMGAAAVHALEQIQRWIISF